MGKVYIYVLTQYGVVFGASSDAQVLRGQVRETLPFHLWPEYKILRLVEGDIGINAVTTFRLPEFMAS
jgi:hypothetical protein